MKIVIVVIGLILLSWGLIGSSQVSKPGNTCDLGINSAGSVFCWKWHQNVIGDIQEGLDNLLNG
jgi:hypothetical protein